MHIYSLTLSQFELSHPVTPEQNHFNIKFPSFHLFLIVVKNLDGRGVMCGDDLAFTGKDDCKGAMCGRVPAGCLRANVAH